MHTTTAAAAVRIQKHVKPEIEEETLPLNPAVLLTVQRWGYH